MTDTVIEPEAFKRKSGKKGRGQVSATDTFSEELLEDARDVGLSEGVIDAGGDYRQLSKGKIFWLPLPELVTFEHADIDTEDDDEFIAWFKAFIDEKELQTKSQRTQKATKTWRDWDSGYSWDQGRTSIGKWWSNWGYSSEGGSGSELTRRLAIALKAITTTVSVVNDTDKRYRVRLASDTPDAPTSYTSYNEQLLVVTPQALLDTSITQDEGIEITTMFSLHEASHVKYSASLMDALTKPTKLRPQSVAGLLHNLLEDMRIEFLTALKFPGFAEYFVAGNHWLYNTGKERYPDQWGPKLQDKVNAAIAMSKFSADYKERVDASPTLTAEWPWWREWAETYTNGKEPIRQSVIRALEHLAEDEDTKKEMQELAQDEAEIERLTPRPVTDEQFKELLKKLKEQLDKGGQVMEPCPSPGGGPPVPRLPGQAGDSKPTPVLLTKEQAAEIEKLIGEQYQQFEAFYKMQDGPSDVAPIIEMSRPQETEFSRGLYQKPGPLVERLREVFYFRKQAARETERLLKTGFVDEEELWRAGTGDARVFERTVEPDEHYTSVTMLVDTSGSMIGSGLDKAMEMANAMMFCLRTARGVRTRVRAHTTGQIKENGVNAQTCRMFKIWDPGDPDTRLGLLGSVPHGANFDGFAIDWCAKELNDTAATGEEKLLIVLSDGLPNGNVAVGSGLVHYGGGPAMDHMKQMGEYWGRQGVTIVQIAIDADSIRPEDQARMFKHWIGYESDRKLLTDLTRLLIKAFGGVE